MNDPYIGVIIPFAGTFAPSGWALCNGQLLSIADNMTLYTLIGTTYGGDGVNTFGLPNLQGRMPIGTGTGPGLSNYAIGQVSGTESVTLTTGQMPAHTHTLTPSLTLNAVTGIGNTMVPTGNYLAANRSLTGSGYAANAGTGTTNNLNSGTVVSGSLSSTGGSQPFSILQPTLAITYIIALYGEFPSRN